MEQHEHTWRIVAANAQGHVALCTRRRCPRVVMSLTRHGVALTVEAEDLLDLHVLMMRAHDANSDRWQNETRQDLAERDVVA